MVRGHRMWSFFQTSLLIPLGSSKLVDVIVREKLRIKKKKFCVLCNIYGVIDSIMIAGLDACACTSIFA